MGFWRRTDAGREYSCPGRNGIYIDGPLTSDDLVKIIQDLVEEPQWLAREEGKGET